MAFKIAAHAVDIAKKRPHARERDDAMAKARYNFNWEDQFSLALDPDKARERRNLGVAQSKDKDDYCTMCGPDFCAMRVSTSIKL